MKMASVSELKNGLSGYLREVISGETVIVTDRKRPVAVFRPIEAGGGDAQVSGLIASGVATPPEAELDVESFLSLPIPKSDAGLTRAILEEREER